MRRVNGTSELKMLQYANDWVAARNGGGDLVTLHPTRVEVSTAELTQMEQHTGVGTFWDEWQPKQSRPGWWRFTQKETKRRGR